MPTVSVIIPNYNHAQFLRQRVESVLEQTFHDFELILLDDCSTDGSQAILREYAADPRVRMEFNEKNSGSTFKQWNKGVRLTQGKYVWIAESDDYADPHLLEKLVSRLDAEPGTVLCNCRSWRVSAGGEILGTLDSHIAHLDPQRWRADFLADGPEECRRYLVRCCTILNASSVLFRKAVYDQVGGADESFLYCGDWKLWAALALTGGRIAYIGEPLNYYRMHEGTVTAKSKGAGIEAAEYLRVIRWILQRVTPEEETREKVCNDVFELWYPALLAGNIPLGRRWAILGNARAVDPDALGKLFRSALVALRMTLARRYRSWRLRF